MTRDEKMKKILVATGTSENKKKFAMDFIKQYLQSKNIEAEVIGANIYDVRIEELSPDVIVAIGPINFATDLPIVNGTPFITKIGLETACESIIAAM